MPVNCAINDGGGYGGGGYVWIVEEVMLLKRWFIIITTYIDGLAFADRCRRGLHLLNVVIMP